MKNGGGAGVKFQFDVGTTYSRNDVARGLGLDAAPKGGVWATGYLRQQGAFLIFCGVGTPGRTGHDYGNHFDGDELIWSGKTGSRKGQPIIDAMCRPDAEVHVFWRQEDRDLFTYAGLGRAVSVSDDIPVQIRWKFLNSNQGGEGWLAEEISTDVTDALPATVLEGAVKRVSINAYERNPVARKICIAAHGCRCAACDFDFEAVYGDVGRGFIHVHHLRPISSIGESYVLDPVRDLIPLCPNCHAMVHRSNPPATIDAVRELINGRR